MPTLNLKETGRRPTQMHERAQIETRYNSRRWRALRLAYLKENPLCVCCSRASEVCDHITPVRLGGDFWLGPFRALCARCHNTLSAIQRTRPETTLEDLRAHLKLDSKG